MIVLFDITTRSDTRPSPFCWRAKLALRHKALAFESRGTVYSQIRSLGNGSFKTLPVIDHDGTWVGGSSQIAEYLESKVASRSLFPGDPGRLFANFVESWVDTTIHAQIFPLVALRAWECFPPSEQEYFRSTREQRLGMSLEAAREQTLPKIPAIRRSLDPARRILRTRRFLAGSEPAYADYTLFGALKWQRLLSEDCLLTEIDPVEEWYKHIDAIAQEL